MKRSSIFDSIVVRSKIKRHSGDPKHALHGKFDEDVPAKANPFEEPPPAPFEEYVADEEARPALGGRLLRYCRSKDLQDTFPEPIIAWGSIVVGQDAGDGWLVCGDGVYLPMKIAGRALLTHRQYSMILVPKPQKWVRKPWPPPPPEAEDEPDAKVVRGSEYEHEDGVHGESRNSETDDNVGDLGSMDSHALRGSINSGGSTHSSNDPAESTIGKTMGARGSMGTTKKMGILVFADEEFEFDASVLDLTAFGAKPKMLRKGSTLGNRASSKVSKMPFVSSQSEELQEATTEDPPDQVQDLIEKMSVESRLLLLEPSHWLAPAGMRAPHIKSTRNVPDDLQEAVVRGDITLVRNLIEAGVSVNAPIRTLQDEEFLTLLHLLACRPCIPNGTRVLVELLKRKANPNTRSSKGSTPLIFACLHKNVGAVEVLLEFGAEVTPVDDNGRTALRCAMIPDSEVPDCEDLAVEIAELLSAAGADLDAGGDVAPIVEAVVQHNGQAVKALLRLGVTPGGLSEAVCNAPVAIIQDLLEAEGNPFIKNASNQTVMEIALGRGEELVTTMLRDYIGNLERSNHPHLYTRTKMGPQDWEQDANLLVAANFEPKERRDGERKSLATHMIEEHLRQMRPLTRRDRFNVFMQRTCKYICRSYTFQTIMISVLCCALFLPDLWVAANMVESGPLDDIIVVMFVLFFVEFTLQCIGFQKQYMFRFTFWMDILGWWSVPLDHSLVTTTILSSFQMSVDGPTLARLTKLVKLGARAGRMSRLVKLLRFLPGMGNAGNHAGTAAVMSKMVNMRISIQVASVIIVMVIVLPLMDISRYPTVDHSMMAWAKLLDNAATNHPDDFGTLVDYMADFYSKVSYHPYEVTALFANGTTSTISLQPPPRRRQDILLVIPPGGNTTANTITFNFRGPNFAEALCSALMMGVIILIIFIAAILVSSGVTIIVLRPLEQLLGVVKDVAGTIFASVDHLSKAANKNKNEDADSDVEEGNEAMMLEKVLKKLTALSELTVKKSPIEGFADVSVDEKRTLVDYGISHCEETDLIEAVAGRERLSVAAIDRLKVHELEAKVGVKMTESGVTYAAVMDWNYDIMDMNTLQRETLAICLINLYETPITDPSYKNNADHIFGTDPEASTGLAARRGSAVKLASDAGTSSISPTAGRRRSSAVRRGGAHSTDDLAATIVNFVMAVSGSYEDEKQVPYHNFAHALDVTLTLHHVLRSVHAENFFSMAETLGLIVAALAHDIGHSGVDNRFLTVTGDPLALIYNDQSVLENMHCARLFEITSRPGCTIFQKMEPTAFCELRSVCVQAILGTDIKKSKQLVREMVLTFEMKQDVFDGLWELHERPERLPPFDLISIFGASEQSSMLRKFFVHFCDQSNSFKSWKICNFWGKAMLEEFSLQGQREAELGLPVSYLFDKKQCCGPKALITIIDHSTVPLCVAARNLFPALLKCEDAMVDNMGRWAREYQAKKPTPTDEEITALAQRRGTLRREQKERMEKMRKRAMKAREDSEGD